MHDIDADRAGLMTAAIDLLIEGKIAEFSPADYLPKGH